MIMQGQFNKSSLMMGTQEIASLTGKPHDLVMRKARTMINVLISESRDLRAGSGAGWRESLYAPGECAHHRIGRLKELFLDHELSLCLLTDRVFTPVQRLRVIRRWQVLESRQQRAVTHGTQSVYMTQSAASVYI